MTYQVTVKNFVTGSVVTRTYWWEDETTSDPEAMGEQIRDMIESVNNTI